MKCACGKETKNPKYCSRSCAVTSTNRKHPKRTPQVRLEWTCKNCGKHGKAECRSKLQSYCSNQCQKDHEYQERICLWESDGVAPGLSAQRRYIQEKSMGACAICRQTSWMGSNIPLELDHIDGNASNNTIQNLRMLCPNCHAQTPTYKNKNKGRGRVARRERYRQGKSY